MEKASVRSLPVLSFIVSIFKWNVPLVSRIFLKRSPGFPFLLFSSICIDHLGSLSYISLLFSGIIHSDGYIFPFLLCLSPLFFSQLFSKVSSDNHFVLHFFFLGMVWSAPSVQCHEPLSIVLQALCLPHIIPWIYLSLPLYNIRHLILVIAEGPSGFSYFLQFKSEFCNTELMIWATVSSRSCFCSFIEVLHLWLQGI